MQSTISRFICIAAIGGSLLAPMSLGAQTTLSLRDAARLESTRAAMAANGRHAPASAAEAHRVTLLISLDTEHTSVAPLEQLGLEVTLRMGRRLIATAPLDAVERIALCAGVTSVDLDSELKPLNNIARAETGVDAIRSGEGSLPQFTGKGVLAGIVDRGFDTNHIMYRDADGNTRIRLIAMYPATTGSIISTTPEEIDSFGFDYSIMTHGAHVLGTMAGSACISDNGADYSGVAPESDIAIATGILTEANLIAGMEQIYNLAQANGQPCVINISQGTSWGPHDGSDTFTAMINDMAARDGLTVVMAAGNEGSLPVSVTGTFTEETPFIQTALTATESALYSSSPLSQGLGDIDVWSEDNTPVEVEFVIVDLDNPSEPFYVHPVPEGATAQYIGTGRAYMGELKTKPTEVEAFKDNYSNGYLGGRSGIDPTSGRYRCELRAYLTSKTEELQKRVVSMVRVKGQPGKRVFIYNENYNLAFSDYGQDWINGPTPDGTVSNIACGNNVIVAGSYAIRNAPGSPYDVEEIGKVTSSSSWGRLADGRLLPDVVAPGHLLYSTLNGALVARSDYESTYSSDYPVVDAITDSQGTKHYITHMGGTSMASPFCAGVVALMLQANPDLTTGAIRDILHATAAPQQEPGSGAGKINALEAVKSAYSLNSIRGVKADNEAGISVTPLGNGIFTVYAPGENSFSVNVFTTSGVMLSSAHAISESIDIDLSSLPEGVYIISAQGGKSTSAAKILR